MLKKIIKACLSEDQMRQVTNYRIKQKYLKNKKILKNISDKENYINNQFEKEFGYKIDFTKEPKTFSEKIQFRKIYSSNKKNELYTLCSDKYLVREYVAKKIGKEFLIPLLLVTKKLSLEQWEKLPDKFVAKANHNSGPVQIVSNKNKENAKKIIAELEFQLKIDYGVISLEEFYSNIPKKIIIEKFLNFKGKSMQDYKFHCFNSGEIFVEHILERNENVKEKKVLKTNFYDENWNKLNFSIGTEIYNENINKPKNFEKMKNIAKKLAEDFDYVRVDLYNLDGKIYFGELTFSGDSGLQEFSIKKWNIKFGEIWNQQL
ncbi:MAG: ATP-grasp fold amidoligase family protein [Cetobacterium sp.]|uniref:ATP-grasp fold amidoligase family protein n=1 Tax=Cetobacterium sp. TaxID=2071632 RepID=UPI002FC7720B